MATQRFKKFSGRVTTLFIGELIIMISFLAAGSMARHGSPHFHNSCNKTLCAPKVSYCMVSETCNCDPTQKPCTCCDECSMCLAEDFEQCCSCIGMCKSSNMTGFVPTTTSSVGYLEEPDADLFKTLTDEPVSQLKYSIVKFPVIEELAFHHHHKHRHGSQQPVVIDQLGDPEISKKDYWMKMQIDLSNVVDFDNTLEFCTVIYPDHCTSMNECSMYCTSMGANSFRWFHNGCCECVGPTCLNYGNQYPKCRDCLR